MWSLSCTCPSFSCVVPSPRAWPIYLVPYTFLLEGSFFCTRFFFAVCKCFWQPSLCLCVICKALKPRHYYFAFCMQLQGSMRWLFKAIFNIS